jgi:hypothetical protein
MTWLRSWVFIEKKRHDKHSTWPGFPIYIEGIGINGGAVPRVLGTDTDVVTWMLFDESKRFQISLRLCHDEFACIVLAVNTQEAVEKGVIGTKIYKQPIEVTLTVDRLLNSF